ncbi:geranylgeranyltransferase I beta subunit Cwg2 [Schizosaccharomyces japonicus yFS275]|uniref:Geranylgeranyltransferase I beta subunit Cwg2 n=1 Tax=Schizosaccharomyces japonicus (strain yFS275 / FY16936) TaxID=402676 RepID=B6K347_SCHJY|nr:geranylgeranyltransferase I beta subunit Cwg2 [Schizosaccharomyces japonicus yFS275]EEB07904.1 geranylgeranyltransferase I beta subunit Cwg2 [Schizosaccharomyces japonicus yFS275]
MPELQVKKHIAYFKRNLMMFPQPYQEMDSERMVLGYFCLLGLDLLKALEEIREQDKIDWIAWVRSCRVAKRCDSIDKDVKGDAYYVGYRGGPCTMTPGNEQWDEPMLAGTLFAACNLLFLGDNPRSNTEDMKGIERFLQLCLCEDGRYRSNLLPGADEDIRQLYMAVSTATLLELKLKNVEQSLDYIKSCQRYEGGFGQTPGAEAHAGATFCAIASWKLLNKMIPEFRGKSLKKCIPHYDRLLRWLVFRQQSDGGFNGRTQKLTDTCYSFWVQATLSILGEIHLVEANASRNFLLEQTQHLIGGFSKVHGEYPDVLHSALGLFSLALHDDSKLSDVCPALCLTARFCPEEAK